jgi:DNA-nicking Smr family endonuclease
MEGKNVVLALFFMGKRRNQIESDSADSADSPPFIDPVVVPIEDHLDLHPFQPKEIPSVVEEYLIECRKAGLRQVRLIHGKGKGVQRNIIRTLLENHVDVETFHDAPLEAGSWGATVVILKG